MPIRIKRDKNSNRERRNYPGGGGGNTGGGGRGGGIIGVLLPLILRLVGKNPKLLLIIAVIGGAWYFLGGAKGCGGVLPTNTDTNTNVDTDLPVSPFETGMEMSTEKYASTDIYEPLWTDRVKNPLPNKVSLRSHAPTPKNQGRQGSCVGWASSYAARSILESRQSGNSGNQSMMSPSYLYNQIALTNCQGSYLQEAMKTMKQGGVVPFNDFRYDDSSCSNKPRGSITQKAKDYTIDGYNRLSGKDQYAVDLKSIRQNIAAGAPVVIGMMVGGSFMRGMKGKDTWRPSQQDASSIRSFGGHAMCVIGYDDYKDGGSFEIQNSWGTDWGDGGFFWMAYDDFAHFTKEAYGVHPMGNANAPTGNQQSVEIGLRVNGDKENISIDHIGGNDFKLSRPLRSNEEFKLEVRNEIPCYVYVFGQETDGSSYTLFPYTKKHSPYCGVTGTRLFPNDHSLYPDDKGSEDYMAVVFSNDPLNFDDFKRKLSSASGNSYSQKLNNVLSSYGRANPRIRSGRTASADYNTSEASAWGMVLTITK